MVRRQTSRPRPIQPPEAPSLDKALEIDSMSTDFETYAASLADEILAPPPSDSVATMNIGSITIPPEIKALGKDVLITLIKYILTRLNT